MVGGSNQEAAAVEILSRAATHEDLCWVKDRRDTIEDLVVRAALGHVGRVQIELVAVSLHLFEKANLRVVVDIAHAGSHWVAPLEQQRDQPAPHKPRRAGDADGVPWRQGVAAADSVGDWVGAWPGVDPHMIRQPLQPGFRGAW